MLWIPDRRVWAQESKSTKSWCLSSNLAIWYFRVSSYCGERWVYLFNQYGIHISLDEWGTDMARQWSDLGPMNKEIDLLWSRIASLWKNYERLGKKVVNFMLLYKVTIVWELWESFASKQIWITIGDILLQRQKCPPSCMAMWDSRQNGH